MLDANLKAQLQAYLERLVNPIELIASLDDSQAAQELHQLLQEIARLKRLKFSHCRTCLLVNVNLHLPLRVSVKHQECVLQAFH
jgi:hypothetical protein